MSGDPVRGGSTTAPVVSVVVAVLNGAKTLQRCIDSVASQTYAGRELVVIDGGSRDGSVDIIRANAARIQAWLSESDRGIYNAWNKGLSRARGEWVCFLGADDRFHDRRVLERMSPYLARREQRIVYGQVSMVDADGAELDRLGTSWEEVKGIFFDGTYCLPTPGVMLQRALFETHGRFDESFRIAGDYEFLLRTLKSGLAPLYVPGIVVTDMQQGGISSRPESTLVSLREMRAARAKHGLPRLNPGAVAAFSRAYARVILWRLFGERTARRVMDWGRRLRGKAPYWTRA